MSKTFTFPNPPTFGKILNIGRTDRGLSMDTLAEKVGVSRQTISNWERDKALPDMVRFKNLAKALDVSYEWLLGDHRLPDKDANAVYEDIGLSGKSIMALRRDYTDLSDTLSSMLESNEFYIALAFLDKFNRRLKTSDPENFDFLEDSQQYENIEKEREAVLRYFEDCVDSVSGYPKWKRVAERTIKLSKAAMKQIKKIVTRNTGGNFNLAFKNAIKKGIQDGAFFREDSNHEKDHR